MIKSGACDSLEGTREQLYNNIENALKIGTQHVRERDSIQSSLFSADISLSSTIPLDYNDNYGSVIVTTRAQDYIPVQTIVDFSDDLLAGGFQLNNPNANRTCGCGTSFSA